MRGERRGLTGVDWGRRGGRGVAFSVRFSVRGVAGLVELHEAINECLVIGIDTTKDDILIDHYK